VLLLPAPPREERVVRPPRARAHQLGERARVNGCACAPPSYGAERGRGRCVPGGVLPHGKRGGGRERRGRRGRPPLAACCVVAKSCLSPAPCRWFAK
jgi:hypothetical protein